MKYSLGNTLKVVTLCSGYDSQCMALERLKKNYPDFNYELTAWCEIDKDAIAAHTHPQDDTERGVAPYGC